MPTMIPIGRNELRCLYVLAAALVLAGCRDVALLAGEAPPAPRPEALTYVIPVTVQVDDVQPMGQYGYILGFQCDPIDLEGFWHLRANWCERPYYPTDGPPWHFAYEVKRPPATYDVSCHYSLMYDGECRVRLLPDGSIDPAAVVMKLEPEADTVRTTIALHIDGPDDADPALLRTRPIECYLNAEGDDKTGPRFAIGVPSTGFPIEARYDVRLHYGPHEVSLWHGKGQLTGKAEFTVGKTGSITPATVRVTVAARPPREPEDDPIGTTLKVIERLEAAINEENAARRPRCTAWALSSLNTARKQLPKLLIGDSMDDALRKRLPLLRRCLESESEVLQIVVATVLMELDEDSGGKYTKIALGLDESEEEMAAATADGEGDRVVDELKRAAFRDLRSKRPEHRLRGLLFCTLVRGEGTRSLWDRLTSEDADERRGAVEEMNDLAGVDIGIDPDRFREWSSDIDWEITEEGVAEFLAAGTVEEGDEEKAEAARPACPYDAEDLAATGRLVTAALEEARVKGIRSPFPTLEKLQTLHLRHIIWAARITRAEGMPDPYSVFGLDNFRSCLLLQPTALLLTERKDEESYPRILELTEANIDWLFGFPATTLENMETPEAVQLLWKNARSRIGIMNVIWSVDSLVRMGHTDAFELLFEALEVIDEDTWSPWDEPMPDEDEHPSSEVGLLTRALSDFTGVDKAVDSTSSKADGARAVTWWRMWWKQNADRELPFLKTWPRKQWRPGK